MAGGKFREVWQEALNQIHDEYKNAGSQQEEEFELWFKMDYLGDEGDTITVSVPSEFFWSKLQEKGYVKKVADKIKELTGQKKIEIAHIASNESIATQNETKPSSAHSAKQKTQNAERGQIERANQKEKKHPQLSERFTFDSFIPGNDNSFAYNAALAAAKEPGKRYNPLLLYGGVGLGKTHLMQAIGNYLYKNDGALKICYISAEDFTNEFIWKLYKEKAPEKFKSKYRNLDALLIDDIHFLQNKTAVQEELFYTFNALRDKGSQLVFTCDRPINELKEFADRLKSRISNGFSIDLKMPTYETRYAIILKKLELQGKTIPNEIIDYIAKNVESNVRDLEGALTKMIGYADLIQKPLTIKIAQEQLRDIFTSPSAGNIPIEAIQKIVAEAYQISAADIKSKKRDKKFAVPRQIAVYIARELTEYSFTELGGEFGGRDHSTIMHSYEKIAEQIKIDSSLNGRIQLLMREIKEYKK